LCNRNLILKDCPMPNFKDKAEKLENRLIGTMQTNERRQTARMLLPVADMRRAARSLESRAEWLDKRREPDPMLRAMAKHEAEHCRRIALTITEAMRGAA
jgi:cobyrinic acid a,c-diamide synthase